MLSTWPCKSGFDVQQALQKGPGFLDFWPCQIGFGPNAGTPSLKKKGAPLLVAAMVVSQIPKKTFTFFCPTFFSVWQHKVVPIILHHMASYDGGCHHMMGGGHHMMGKSHHMMGKSHHMMGKGHHMMGGAIILHHMMQYDGPSSFQI